MRMDATTHTRFGVGDLGALIVWVVGLMLILSGPAAADSGDRPFPGFLVLGTLVLFISLCWSLTSMASVVARLGREPETAMTALCLNAAPWCGTVLLAATAWALNAS